MFFADHTDNVYGDLENKSHDNLYNFGWVMEVWKLKIVNFERAPVHGHA
jgi:hypothetical protein